MPKKPSKTIVLELGKTQIPIRRFKEAISAFFDLLESVSKDFSPDKQFKWTISVQEGSARVVAHAESKGAAPILKAIPAGMAKLEKGGIDALPKHFSESAIRAAQRLASVRDRGDEAIPVTLTVGKSRKEITAKTSVTVSNLVETAYQSYGSIEGKLVMLTDDGGFKFAVHQRLFDRRVICFVDDALVPDAIAAFRHRVTVRGKIQYNRVGNPISVQVGDIIPFPSNDGLPSLSVIRGILEEKRA